MNADRLAMKYDRLTPEERFRLILAAADRGDDTEQQRLIQTGQKIQLSFRDHTPWSHAFGELATYYFIELANHAASYLDSFARADLPDVPAESPPMDGPSDSRKSGADCDSDAGAYGSKSQDSDADEAIEDFEAEDADAEALAMTDGERWLQNALAEGHILKVKVQGWNLFCKRLNIRPFVLWEDLPGFERLKRAIDLAENAAFVEEGFVRLLNETRPAGVPQQTRSPFQADRVADAIDQGFRQRVRWWGG